MFYGLEDPIDWIVVLIINAGLWTAATYVLWNKVTLWIAKDMFNKELPEGTWKHAFVAGLVLMFFMIVLRYY
ncbi:hypothetical protein [Lactobacillus xylocopicola]|uniref:Uncharacterized protein n=1 Tax=Lactobacillus xylocopicola TaxID=2976676 RepID=A0ABM8BI15_9LACO|nr:hypothetical protein [Lactobacillus xylocopicola]BDR60920.1 hypothetical protein KIM322_11810 [Lactobacillus xylocopicola]